jgi:solute:Na+ symporter, SSS family
MNEQVLIILSIILFLVIGFLAKNRKAKSIDSFSTSRNKLNWFVTASGVSMTFVGGAALINMASLGYSYSWDTLIDPIALIIGIVISTLFIKKYRQDNGITISQLLSSNNKKLSLYIGIISSIVFLLITSAQFVALSKILTPFFPSINPTLLFLIPSALILIYVFIGGFSAVTNTDVLQLILILTFIVAPFGYYLLNFNKTIQISNQAIEFSKMPMDLMILLSISIFYVPISQDINIRAKSAKSDNQATLGFVFGAFFYSLIVVICLCMGMALAKDGIKLEDTEQAFTTFFKHYLPQIGIFSVLAGIAAIWSTLDTYLVNGITSVAQDVIKKIPSSHKLQERRIILISGLIVYIISVIFCLYFKQVLSLILTALLIYISVLIPIAFARWLKMKDNYIFAISITITLLIVIIEVSKFDINPKAILYPVFGLVIMSFGKLLNHSTK